jgi:GT2 family glycosyltransferase
LPDRPDHPFLSVVIPTYNRRDSLLRTLNALSAQTLSPSHFEVLVVSDGSPDDTREHVHPEKYPFRLRFMEQQNSGPSVARNNGARAACGEVIVYVDDDIEPIPSFLQHHFDAHQHDDQLVLIGPQSMPPNEWFPVHIAWEHRMLEKQYDRFKSGEWQAGPNNLYSGNFSVRRRWLLECGGFDPTFKRQEDVELGFRLEQLGLHFRFEPRADGYHRPERTFENWYQTPYLYGVRDVQMARDKDQTEAMQLARRHYAERNALTRLMARTCIGRPLLEPALIGALRCAVPILDRIGLRKLALPACSTLFNLRYLQGMAREMGSARSMWTTLSAADPGDLNHVEAQTP